MTALPMPRRFPAILAVLASAALACHRGSVAPSNRTPVILISIDTLRSDHLPAYGYKDVETPHIDALRRDGVLYQHAYAHVPLTLPSHATILTGRLPSDNGVHDNLGFRIADNVATLPELLKRNGYATGAAVSAFVLRKESGIGRGFDLYDDQIDPSSTAISAGRVQRKGSDTVAIAEKWIDERGDEPFFFFLHLYEPHSPYDPPEPYKSRYKPYDGEIAYSDAIVGDFIAHLKQRKIYDRALIILLSDHGEGLGEHGEDEHGIFLYRESLQVPLVVKLPGGAMAGKDVDAAVQLIDVFPTIAQLTATKAGNVPGVSLAEMAGESARHQTERPVYSETLYPRYHFGWSELHSFIDHSAHYIDAPKPELYDLASDPAENHNAIADDRRKLVAMRAAIAPMIKPVAAPSAVSQEEAAKLAALGYIGSTVAADAKDLPDPKDEVATYPLIRRAFQAYDAGRYDEALAAMQELLRRNDRMLDIWDMEARTLEALGRTDEAIDAAKHGLKLSPNSIGLLLMVSKMSLEKEDLVSAQKHAELAMKGEPGAAHDLLARVALARHDLAGAEREAKLALQSRELVLALMTLSRVEIERKNLDGALQYCNRADAAIEQKHGTTLKGLAFLRGDIMARLGRNDDAERAFHDEITLFPRDALAYKHLILLYVTEGRLQDATQLIYSLEKAAPTPPSYAAIATTLRTVGDATGARFWAARGLRQFPNDPTLRKLAAG